MKKKKPYDTMFHRDGTVTVWNVYSQAWERTDTPSARVLASLEPKERERVVRHCQSPKRGRKRWKMKTAMKTAAYETCSQFLADWDRQEWMWENEAGSGEYDPDGVASKAKCLDVGIQVRGWDCYGGWDAYRHGAALYLRWWREPDRHSCRVARDLWVPVDPTFFEEEKNA